MSDYTSITLEADELALAFNGEIPTCDAIVAFGSATMHEPSWAEACMADANVYDEESGKWLCADHAADTERQRAGI